MSVQLRVLFAARFMSESRGDDVAGVHLFADTGAASDSRLGVAIFEDSERGFDGFVVGLNNALIFLD